MKSIVNRDGAGDACANVSEAEMVSRAQECSEAFGPLYELYYGKILGYTYRRTLDACLAEEITSSTFFNAMRALPQYEHRGSFSAWLYKIATNEINVHRRNTNHQRGSNNTWHSELHRVWFISPQGSREDAEEKMRAFAKLHESVENLPEKYRTAISLRYFEAMPYAEIAEVLGKRPGTVKSLVHRGLHHLRRQYKLKSHAEDFYEK